MNVGQVLETHLGWVAAQGWYDDGSDWPVCMVAASYSRVMRLVVNFLDKYPREARESILGGTAQAFWQLPKHPKPDACSPHLL